MKKVLITRRLIRESEDKASKLFEAQFNANDELYSQKKIIEALNPLITAFLKKESVQILLQKEQIIFGDKELDITDEILKIFNDKHKKIKFE